jgi:predicted nucleotidyltransferase
MGVPWEITPDKVQAVIQKIIEVGRPRKLIVFGSYVRGTTHRDSDIDFLVVTGDDIDNPRKESVRIMQALRGLHILADIIVVPESLLRELADTPGLIYREALKTGRVIYEAA